MAMALALALDLAMAMALAKNIHAHRQEGWGKMILLPFIGASIFLIVHRYFTFKYESEKFFNRGFKLGMEQSEILEDKVLRFFQDQNGNLQGQVLCFEINRDIIEHLLKK